MSSGALGFPGLMVSLSERVLRADEFPARASSLREVVGVVVPEGLGNDGFLAFFLRETFPGATLAERSPGNEGAATSSVHVS